MQSLKRCFVFLCCFAMLLSLPVTQPPPSEASIVITIYIGRPPSCTGWGFCKISIGWETVAEAPKGGGTARVNVRKCRASAALKENKLYLDLGTALPERASVVPIGEKLALDPATSKALGFKHVTVLRGEYEIDYSKNKLGAVVLDVEARN